MNWFLLLGAPVSVAGALVFLQDVFIVFAIYHLGFCLLLPACLNLGLRRYSISRHLSHLALTGPGFARFLTLGLALAAALAAATVLAFHMFGDIFLGDEKVLAVLADWGVTRSSLPHLFWFMILINAPAEELYWRGFVHTELSGRQPRFATILLTAACYASYHGVTVYLLVANLPVAVLFMAAILAAGIGWGYLREKTGSVWPALLGHAGAVIGYMVVAKPLLGM